MSVEDPVDVPSSEGSFLGSLTDGSQRELIASGRAVSFRPAASLFSAGDVSNRIGVILEGRVKVSSFTEDGKEIVLAVRGSGDLLGEQSAIDGEPHGATATAMEPARVLIVPADRFLEFLSTHADAAIVLMRMLSARLRDADRKRIEFGAFDTEGRVASRLLELAGTYGRSVDAGLRIDLPLSQQELAGWVGSSREAVTKALQALRGRGFIETERRAITVIDMDGLRRRAT